MKLIGFLIALMIVLLLVYSSFAFIQADLNTNNWHWITRAFFVIAVFGGLVITIRNTYGKIK